MRISFAVLASYFISLLIAFFLFSPTQLVWSQIGEPYQLNQNLVVFGDVGFFQFSSDGNYVVYYADADTDGVRELYSVPITGGTPTKLNAPLPFQGSVERFEISPDDSHVVYIADQDVFDEKELFAVEVDFNNKICFPVKAKNGNVSIICL